MDVEVRIKSIEQRLAEVEAAHRGEADASRQLFDLVRRVDGKIDTLIARTSALEANFSLVNAALNAVVPRLGAVDGKVDAILDFMRTQGGSSGPH